MAHYKPLVVIFVNCTANEKGILLSTQASAPCEIAMGSFLFIYFFLGGWKNGNCEVEKIDSLLKNYVDANIKFPRIFFFRKNGNPPPRSSKLI